MRRELERQAQLEVHAVVADNCTASLEKTNYLLSLGDTRFGALPGPSEVQESRRSVRGYTIALLEHGLAAQPSCSHR